MKGAPSRIQPKTSRIPLWINSHVRPVRKSKASRKMLTCAQKLPLELAEESKVHGQLRCVSKHSLRSTSRITDHACRRGVKCSTNITHLGDMAEKEGFPGE